VTGRAARSFRTVGRWARLLSRPGSTRGVRVFYGLHEIPGAGEPAGGGTVKIQRLARRFPNSPAGFNVLYLASNTLPRDLRPLLWLARRRRAPVVLNQDGVGYPGWAGDETEEVNRPLRTALLAADHVLYQSAFCKESADIFLGEPRGTWEVLHNAVDVERFTPAAARPADGPVLLLGGDQTQAYRVETALRTLAALPDARLIVAGSLVTPVGRLVEELGLEGRVELLGRYAQRDAPSIYRRAHLLLHTKVRDPCPNVVLEAMACGLPVVYPASGGTVELVGDDAGVGVLHGGDWDRDEPPEPEAFAEAVERVLGDRARFSEAARLRAVEHFGLGAWLDRHAELFERLSLR
jgi:glycosyltransferase involved in cell wall biosynthesis